MRFCSLSSLSYIVVVTQVTTLQLVVEDLVNCGYSDVSTHYI